MSDEDELLIWPSRVMSDDYVTTLKQQWARNRVEVADVSAKSVGRRHDGLVSGIVIYEE
jgi:hypothetical protein